jgi:hypothetical protein
MRSMIHLIPGSQEGKINYSLLRSTLGEEGTCLLDSNALNTQVDKDEQKSTKTHNGGLV